MGDLEGPALAGLGKEPQMLTEVQRSLLRTASQSEYLVVAVRPGEKGREDVRDCDALCSSQLLRVHIPPHHKPDRSYYTITPSGRAALSSSERK